MPVQMQMQAPPQVIYLQQPKKVCAGALAWRTALDCLHLYTNAEAERRWLRHPLGRVLPVLLLLHDGSRGGGGRDQPAPGPVEPV